MSISSLDNKQTAKRLTSNVVAGISEQIQRQAIAVGPKKMDVNAIIEKQQKGKKMFKKEAEDKSLDKLNEIKRSKLMEIREIQKQEDMLKKSAVLSKSKASKSCTKLWKSQFTEEEMEQIRKIKRKQRQYERQLQKKEKKLHEYLEEKRIQDEQLKKQYMAEQCQQRRKQLTKQREELQGKKKSREKHLEEEIKKMKQLKAKKLLHHQMTESWKKYKETQEDQIVRAHAMEKERLRVNSKLIQQHQSKYLELKKDQQKKRQKALQQSRSAQLHLPYIHAQIYYQVQKEEEEKTRLEKMKIQEVQDNILKRKEYSKLVIDQFLPKLRKNSLSDSRQKEDSKLALNVQESHKLGNNYMKSVHDKIKSEHIEKEKATLKITQEPAGNSIFYKNYLRDIKMESQKQNKQSKNDLVEQTMKNSKLSQVEKLHKVRLILDKDTGGKKSDSDMVETLKNKIKVLNEIMH